MWQDEKEERKYCISCCLCDELNFSEFPEDLNCGSSFCNAGDQLWLRNCDEGHGAEFKTMYTDDGLMIQVVDSGRSETAWPQTCVTRTRKHYMQVQTCNATDPTQKWKSISDNHEFNLISYYQHKGEEKNETYCVTQHHHPKDYEILGMKDCLLAEIDNTALWVTYPLD